MVLHSCQSKETVQPKPASKVYSTAVNVSESGAPAYVLPETEIGLATYQGPTALLVVSGKLNTGTPVRITFKQSSPVTAGANITDQVEVYSEKLGDAVQASGRTTRDGSKNAVTGSFTSRFANGTTLDGTIVGLLLP
ncbi:hypothetical protein [Hymenobacter amundsenii]|uniref:hypothetical protein n=1 Tax=Hymenobacter amundsenii TaxID=2006685 RepID=UPI000F82EB24|nr:hypothetical protein [Hymenobacter amundsenii]